MGSGDKSPNLAIERALATQQRPKGCRKIQKQKTRILPLHQKHRRREKWDFVSAWKTPRNVSNTLKGWGGKCGLSLETWRAERMTDELQDYLWAGAARAEERRSRINNYLIWRGHSWTKPNSGSLPPSSLFLVHAFTWYKVQMKVKKRGGWGAQWLRICLWLRLWSQCLGIKSHFRLPRGSLLLPLPVSLPLSVCLMYK